MLADLHRNEIYLAHDSGSQGVQTGMCSGYITWFGNKKVWWDWSFEFQPE